jgi:hypothetical protein
VLRQGGRGVVEREGDVACGSVLARACGGQGRAGGGEVYELKVIFSN